MKGQEGSKFIWIIVGVVIVLVAIVIIFGLYPMENRFTLLLTDFARAMVYSVGAGVSEVV